MRRALLPAALALVLGVNAWVVVAAARNRAAAPGGTAELTERELRLLPLLGDSTVTLLELRWAAVPPEPGGKDRPRWLDRGLAGWLDADKLRELGFDCDVPVTSPHARDHYRAMGPVPVHLVLEYAGEAWRKAGDERRTGTRLFAVDAGRDPQALRRRYPDESLHLIARGLVRPHLDERKGQDGAPAPPPVLLGRIEQVLPATVFVPPPHAAILRDLRARDREEDDDPAAVAPRYAVQVSWGRAHEPWVRGVRRLAPSASGTPRAARVALENWRQSESVPEGR